jgi:ribosome biogenesis protein UTP30
VLNSERSQRRTRESCFINLSQSKQRHLHVSSLSFIDVHLTYDLVLAERSVKVGVLSQKPSQLLANLEKALPSIAKHIQGGWENIQALHIKTNSSVSLPIWTCNLDDSESGRWNGLTAVAPDASDVSGEDSEDDASSEEEEEEEALVVSKKGKRKVQEEESSLPKKKSRSEDSNKPIAKAASASITPPSKVTKSKGKIAEKTSEGPESQPKSKKPLKKAPAVVEENITPVQPTTISGKKNKPSTVGRDGEKHIQKDTAAPPITEKKRTAKVALSAEDLKAKRSVELIEKKKTKGTLSVGKSAKEKLLGKKAGQGR